MSRVDEVKPELCSLARNGVLRAAINTGNRALVQREGDELRGVSPALARRLAHEIGAELELVIYEGAGQVFADAAARGVWDVGFLAVDPIRAERVTFTRPYLTINTTYAVRVDGAVQTLSAVDCRGVAVVVANASAYDLHLTKTLKNATLIRIGTPPESFAAFRDGQGDVVAGVRASLEQFFADDPDVRIFPDVLTEVHQAMVLPQPADPLLPVLDDFVARALADGFVEKVANG